MIQTRANDEDEKRLIDDVRDYGWHLIGVSDDPEGPAFVYSVGLFHTLQHPEIIIFGLSSTSVMGQIINSIGELVRQGRRFADRIESSEVLEGYTCTFREVPLDAYPDYLGFARWYYRPEQFPVLQCVWPDKAGIYPWQAECHPWVIRHQPILAETRGWRFREATNLAVYTTRFVIDEDRPILRVVHDHDGDWQFLCGTSNRSADGRLVSLKSIVELSPGIDELADLPVGWCAERESPGLPWSRSLLS